MSGPLARGFGVSIVSVEDGVRVYVKAGKGMVHELRFDAPVTMQERAMSSGTRTILEPEADDWTDCSFGVSSYRGGNLCVLSKAPSAAGDHPSNISVFYEDDEHRIREKRLQGERWRQGSLSLRCLSGTTIAGVCSRRKDHIMLFFQDPDEMLCFCQYRHAQWGPVVLLEKAVPHTAIAATSWDNASNVRVYWQDTSLAIREYIIGFDRGRIQLGHFVVMTKSAQHIMSAVSWKRPESKLPEIRIFLQRAQDVIIEMAFSAGQWTRSDFVCKLTGLRHFSALVRTSESTDKYCINLVCICEDRRIMQRTFISLHNKWSELCLLHKLNEEKPYESDQHSDSTSSLNSDIYLDTWLKSLLEPGAQTQSTITIMTDPGVEKKQSRH